MERTESTAKPTRDTGGRETKWEIPVCIDPSARCFVLRLKKSVYVMRVSDAGQLLHLGFAPLPDEAPSRLTVERMQDYGDTSYGFDQSALAFEYPTFGEFSHREVALKVAFPNAHAGLNAGEAVNLPVRDAQLRFVGHEIHSDVNPLGTPEHGLMSRITSPRQTLCLRLKDVAYDFFVTLFYRVTPEHDIIERWVELENRTGEAVEVETVDFGALNLPCGRYELRRVKGSWGREFIPVRHSLEQGAFIVDQRGLNTGHAVNPFFLVNERGMANEAGGVVYFGALAWSGNWRLRFETLPQGPCRIFGGYEASDFALTLGVGETHKTPAFVFGCTEEGFGGASRRFHRYIRERVLPAHPPGEFRPVLYNSWEATGFDLSEEKQVELARIAASIGVELFVVDDGWFGARRNDRAGLGDWFVSPDVFPQGLRPLADEVRRLGMKFGLWFEPEMINPNSDLYRAHPEWVLHFPGRLRTEQRNQLILDFGRPEVIAHILGRMNIMIAEIGIDFIKWDMNRYASQPGSVVGKAIWRRHVENVYRIMDRLRQAHPRLEIQSCSGGGGRVDLGILARTDQVWTSDNTDAHDRVFIQEGFSLAYPQCVMEAWVTDEKNGLTSRVSSLDLRFDVAMRGALGIGSPLNHLSGGELNDYRRKIAFYKMIRPVVQEGELYRLSPAGESEYSIWFTILPDASRAVYSMVVPGQMQGCFPAPPRLRGLNSDALYSTVDEHGRELGQYPGWQLMSIGLPGDYRSGGLGCAIRSRTLLLERIG